jgi:hypothetical protein
MALPFSSMVIKLGLNGSLAPGARTSVGMAVPFGQGFERAAIFPPNRIEMRFRR